MHVLQFPAQHAGGQHVRGQARGGCVGHHQIQFAVVVDVADRGGQQVLRAKIERLHLGQRPAREAAHHACARYRRELRTIDPLDCDHAREARIRNQHRLLRNDPARIHAIDLEQRGDGTRRHDEVIATVSIEIRDCVPAIARQFEARHEPAEFGKRRRACGCERSERERECREQRMKGGHGAESAREVRA